MCVSVCLCVCVFICMYVCVCIYVLRTMAHPYVTELILMCQSTVIKGGGYMPRLIHLCDMTSLTWLIHLCDMIPLKWLIHKSSHVTHVHSWVEEEEEDSCRRISRSTDCNESCLTYELVMSHSSMRHLSYMNESCHTFVQGSGEGGGFVSANFESCHAGEYIWVSHITHMNAS